MTGIIQVEHKLARPLQIQAVESVARAQQEGRTDAADAVNHIRHGVHRRGLSGSAEFQKAARRLASFWAVDHADPYPVPPAPECRRAPIPQPPPIPTLTSFPAPLL